MTTPLLDVSGLSKTFGPVKALDDVAFTLNAGEVHALMGENGAGKSTLVKVLAGMHRPSAGRILIDGAEAHLPSPGAATEAGISVVH